VGLALSDQQAKVVKEFETVSLPTVAEATQRLDGLLALTNRRSMSAAVMEDRT